MRHRLRRLTGPLRVRLEWLEGLALWILSHSASVWPPIAVALVLWLTWHTLRDVHIREVRAALRTLDPYWISAACAFTALNVAVMGLYDVIAFRQTRSPALDRWRYGAIAFAWSNFLTLGPLAGPAIRFWLYAPAIDRAADLQGGVVATAIAFMSGLAGWTTAVLVAWHIDAGLPVAAPSALVLTLIIVLAVRWVATQMAAGAGSPLATQAVAIALVGWLDWSLAAAAFLSVVRAGHGPADPLPSLTTFFVGQIVGLVSLAPGGFGSADAYWIARFPGTLATGAGIVAAFRLIYYVVPWAVASMVLLGWATRRAERRIEIARRVIASLIGGGGVLMMISSATPALHARLLTLERFIPLPLVEFGQVVAAMTGLLLLALALKLARGYRAAFRTTMVLLGIGAISTLLKGFDWEEAIVLGALAVAAASHASLFDRDSRGDWIEGPDVALAAAAVAAFFVFGVLSQRTGVAGLARWTELGYRLEGSRFARSVITLTLAVLASAVYVALRAPATFRRPSADELTRALELHSRIGGSSTPLMLANGDKSIYIDGDRGLCAYRVIGPYLVVFADPVVRPDDRGGVPGRALSVCGGSRPPAAVLPGVA